MQAHYQRSFDEIARIVADTAKFFARHEIDHSLRTPVDLCIEELFVNMVTYNTESDSEILLTMEPDGAGVRISLTDYGVARFDPTEVREVDVDAPLAERTPGGLGVYLVMKMVDSIHYEYHNKTSKITFTIKALNNNV